MEYTRLRDVDIKSQLGNRIYLLFIARDISIRPQKDNGEFMVFNMVDRDKSAEAKIFSVTQDIKNRVVEGKVYQAIIDVKNYKKNNKDYLSCIVYDIGETQLDPSAFADWAENLQQYSDSLWNLLGSIYETVYGQIANELLRKYWQDFSTWPAATGQHHTQLGGLLWHVTTVANTSVKLAKVYQEMYGDSFVNMPLLIAGAILHDLMKINELKIDRASGASEYSTNAALSSHIMDALTAIDEIAISKGILHTEEIRLLKHVIASHHGKLEWGSPIVPNTVEAYIISKMDELDTEMWRYNKELKDVIPGEFCSTWRGGELIVRYRETGKK